MATKKRKFVDATVTSVGLVKDGANQRYWATTKQAADPENDMDEIEVMKNVLSAPIEDEKVLAALKAQTDKLSAEGKAAAEGLTKLALAYRDALPAETVEAVMKAAGLGAAPAPQLPAEVLAVVKAIESRAEAAEKALETERELIAKERTARRRVEMIAVAKERMPGAGKAEDIADVLLAVEGLDAALAEKVSSMLSTASSRVTSGDLLSVKGTGSEDEPVDDAASEVLRLAQKDKISVADVLAKNPALYEKYRRASKA